MADNRTKAQAAKVAEAANNPQAQAQANNRTKGKDTAAIQAAKEARKEAAAKLAKAKAEAKIAAKATKAQEAAELSRLSNKLKAEHSGLNSFIRDIKGLAAAAVTEAKAIEEEAQAAAADMQIADKAQAADFVGNYTEAKTTTAEAVTKALSRKEANRILWLIGLEPQPLWSKAAAAVAEASNSLFIAAYKANAPYVTEAGQIAALTKKAEGLFVAAKVEAFSYASIIGRPLSRKLAGKSPIIVEIGRYYSDNKASAVVAEDKAAAMIKEAQAQAKAAAEAKAQEAAAKDLAYSQYIAAALAAKEAADKAIIKAQEAADKAAAKAAKAADKAAAERAAKRAAELLTKAVNFASVKEIDAFIAGLKADFKEGCALYPFLADLLK